ncbi:phosphotransferase enzyme family protein [Ornithinimicrobium sp. Y1694]|uniref:phosphotransferase enzyme family protein n=1 Tax=Ornithinimicrobium sp. Y1694 TaxID=3418590 RepID=UPI003CE837B5
MTSASAADQGFSPARAGWQGGAVDTAYRDLDEASQIEALRRVALAAAEEFGLEVARMEVALHAYNTTFRVDTPDGRIALRVGTNSRSTAEHLRGQQAWQHALATQTAVSVPDPLRTVTGEWFAQVPSAELGRDALATASTWLPGPDIGGDLDPEQSRALGSAMAQLHDHAQVWRVPADASLPSQAGVLLGEEDLLSGWPGFGEEEREVVASALARGDEAISRVWAGQDLVPIHADLHGGNLKWHEGRLAIFDFDDARLAVPALDLANATFYLREPSGESEAALREGYAAVRELPEVSDADLEALLAARQVLLANDILSSTTEVFRGQAVEYPRVAAARLAGWLASGRFERTKMRL